jgi:hypothetical protein
MNRHHYHAWAFVRDVEWSSTLSQVARGISKVRFSLSLQSSEYRNYGKQQCKVSRFRPNMLSIADVARPEQYAPPPVHAVSQRSTSKGRAPKSGIVKPLVNHVSFDGPTSAASQPMAKRFALSIQNFRLFQIADLSLSTNQPALPVATVT